MRFLTIFIFLSLLMASPDISGQNTFIADPAVHDFYKSGLDETNDTLGYPMNSTPSVYTFSTDLGEFRGYMCGNNAFLDKAKVQFFSDHPHYAGIMGVRMKFARATGNGHFKVGIWESSSQSGLPAALIYEQQVSIPDIIQHVSDSSYTDITFDSLVSNPGPFYIGFIIPTDPGDTVVLYSSKAGESSTSNGWEMRASGSWYNFAVAYGHQFNVELYVFPIMTGVMGKGELTPENKNSIVEIWPNPAHEILNVKLNPEYVKTGYLWYISDIQGNIIINESPSRQSSNESESIDISSLAAGVYYFSIQTTTGIFTKKLVVTP
ncbi:MAG: T9SS type A sorting domain-containing protein [Bacteroidales bacterium]|nr:T9SS type A sorting domain-containing protein [Bacteroidales bacterium]